MTKDDLCNRCGHRRELHRPEYPTGRGRQATMGRAAT